MLIYHSPLVKGKTRKRKTGGAGTLCGKRKQPGINCFPILIKLGRRISVSYPGAFPPWPVKAVVHYSWTATMNPKQKKWTGRHIPLPTLPTYPIRKSLPPGNCRFSTCAT